MTFTKGNLQLRDHKENNKTIFLFSADKYPLTFCLVYYSLISFRKNSAHIFEGEVEVAKVEVTGVASIFYLIE